MQALIAVLRAAHCKSVHHYFALDALQEVRTESGRQLSRMLLAHFSEYLQGAKDPDSAFKISRITSCMSRTVLGRSSQSSRKVVLRGLEHLDAGRWSDASYSIGV